jgi:cytosine/uracil/thiamine/allantoin permease
MCVGKTSLSGRFCFARFTHARSTGLLAGCRIERPTAGAKILGINVVANFVSPAFDFANVFPKQISFKRGGYIAALIALVLYPFAPWEGGAAAFVGGIGATMGSWWGVYGWFFGAAIGGGVYYALRAASATKVTA